MCKRDQVTRLFIVFFPRPVSTWCHCSSNVWHSYKHSCEFNRNRQVINVQIIIIKQTLFVILGLGGIEWIIQLGLDKTNSLSLLFALSSSGIGTTTTIVQRREGSKRYSSSTVDDDNMMRQHVVKNPTMLCHLPPTPTPLHPLTLPTVLGNACWTIIHLLRSVPLRRRLSLLDRQR